MTADRRRSHKERRTAARVAAVFAVKSVVRGRMQLGQAEDICPTGMTIRRPKDLALSPGTGVVLTFALPGNGAMMRLGALVVSDRLSGSFRRTGLSFVALAADQQQQIAGFHRAQLTPAYPTAHVA
jgi:hypothetical protein